MAMPVMSRLLGLRAIASMPSALGACTCSGLPSAACDVAASLQPSCSSPLAQQGSSQLGWQQLVQCRGLARAKGSSGASSSTDKRSSDPDSQVEVVLLKPFPRVGKKGSVVKVNAGWMRHQLFPRGWAVYATPENIEQHRMSDEDHAKLQDPQQVAERRLVKLINTLNTMVVHIPRRNKFMQKQPDEMVGSVTAWDILTASERQYGIRLHESHLLMEGPITAFGTFKVPLNLRTKEDRQCELTVCVNSVRWINHGHNYV